MTEQETLARRALNRCPRNETVREQTEPGSPQVRAHKHRTKPGSERQLSVDIMGSNYYVTSGVRREEGI